MNESSSESPNDLSSILALNVPNSRSPHVLVLMPSFSIGETTFLHYADQIPYLEHRYLTALPLLERVPGARMVYLCTTSPSAESVDYNLSLISTGARESVRDRLSFVPVNDGSARPLAQKLLDRPDLLHDVRGLIAGDPAWIEPWNVTEAEMTVARQLGIPVHGTPPDLWPLGFKSSGRRLFREAGVPLPEGREDLRTIDDVVAAIHALLHDQPDMEGVVIKHDNAGSGDGNAVIRFRGGSPVAEAVEALPDWFLDDLQAGAVVEELICGDEFTSPSAQIDIIEGSVLLRATHEQLLGGDDQQTFMGCEFPARPEYAPDLARDAEKVGHVLANAGVVGRVAIDFAAARDSTGRWRTFALEINLRKGGTTHPYAALRNLVPGQYHAAEGRWIATDGSARRYVATDSVVDRACVGVPAQRLIEYLAHHGVGFDPILRTGTVLHMLDGFPATGRVGVIAIDHSVEGAKALEMRVRDCLATLARNNQR